MAAIKSTHVREVDAMWTKFRASDDSFDLEAVRKFICSMTNILRAANPKDYAHLGMVYRRFLSLRDDRLLAPVVKMDPQSTGVTSTYWIRLYTTQSTQAKIKDLMDSNYNLGEHWRIRSQMRAARPKETGVASNNNVLNKPTRIQKFVQDTAVLWAMHEQGFEVSINEVRSLRQENFDLVMEEDDTPSSSAYLELMALEESIYIKLIRAKVFSSYPDMDHRLFTCKFIHRIGFIYTYVGPEGDVRNKCRSCLRGCAGIVANIYPRITYINLDRLGL